MCDCSEGVFLHLRDELLQLRWWPTTVHKPSTAVTFACLDLFLALTTQGKLNMYDFYKSLTHLTDNMGIMDTQVYIFFRSADSLIADFASLDAIQGVFSRRQRISAHPYGEAGRARTRPQWNRGD